MIMLGPMEDASLEKSDLFSTNALE